MISITATTTQGRKKTHLEVVRFRRKLPLDFTHTTCTKIQHKNQNITKQEIEQHKYRNKYKTRSCTTTTTNHQLELMPILILIQPEDQGNKHQESKLYNNIHCIFVGPAVARLVGSSHRNRGAEKRGKEDWIQIWDHSWIALSYPLIFISVRQVWGGKNTSTSAGSAVLTGKEFPRNLKH